MLNKGWILFITCLLFSFQLWSQEDEKQKIIEARLEILVESLDEDSELDFTAIFDNLVYYYNHPLNLNRATRDELIAMYILDDFQINSLQSHISKFGSLKSIFELQAVEGFDRSTIDFLLPFVKVSQDTEMSDFTLNELLTEGANDLFLRFQTTLETELGYSPIEAEELAENPNRRYLGNDHKYFLRYRYKYRNKLSFGITAEKDAGEEFFTGTQANGFDYYSAHLFYNGKGLLRKVALGDYAVNLGQGLTFHSSLAFGKSAFVMNIKKGGNGLRPYTSVDENRFLRGAGVALGHKNFEWTFFYSNKNIDGNLISNPDTTDLDNLGEAAVSISSFQASGFHRTPGELIDKDAINEQIWGSNLRYDSRNFKFGASAYRSLYDGTVNRNLQLYNQNDFNANENFVAGVDYNWIKNNVNFFGEISRSQNGGMAYLHGAILALDPHFSVSILHRHFENDYQNLLSNAFAEGTNFANERGLYIGGELLLSKKWNILGYYDQFRFPWLRFSADAPSKGYDYLAQITYKPQRGNEFYVRIRQEEKDRNDSSIDTYIDSPVSEKRRYFRIHGAYKVSESVKFKTRAEWMTYDLASQSETGFLFYQDIQIKKLNWPVSFSLRYALFDTDSYRSRIYAYENDLLYAWSVPAYADRGSRFYIMAKWRIFRKTDLWVRYSIWDYNNRTAISSGLNQIEGNQRSELKMQLRVRF